MPDPAAHFERIVCINLDRRPDRWASFVASASAHIDPARIERFSAIDASTIRAPSWWNDTPGAWACTLSHEFVLARAAHDAVASILVFEDDAKLAPDFSPRLADFLDRVPSDWGLLYLGGQHKARFAPYAVAPGVVRCRRTIRMHAYAVSRDALPIVHDVVARRRMINDQAVALALPRLNAYAPEEFFVAQGASFSDVQGRSFARDRWFHEHARTDSG